MTNDEGSPNVQNQISQPDGIRSFGHWEFIRHSSFVIWISSLLLVSLPNASGAAEPDNSPDIDALIRSADQWAKENLDEDALRVLRSVDQAKVKQVFGELQ